MDFKSILNQSQVEAVTSTGCPVLVVAGAGSGKTRVITCRIIHLIENGTAPWNILAVTFTNKAAGEMMTRVKNYFGRDTRINIGTFHSICAKILRSEINRLGYSSNFLIYDESDQNTLMKRVCKELNLNDKIFSPQAVLSKISNAKNQLWTAEVFKQNAEDYYYQAISKAYDLYEKKKKQNNALDFDDIIMDTVLLFERFPEVIEKYRQRFQYILVDEYQDTNRAQYCLIRQLAGDGKNLCVVGDPDQSIYGWRGADIKNILQFEEDYSDAKVIRLEQNYRSTQNILSAANSVIVNNRQRKHKNLWSENGEGELVSIFRLNDELAEARFAVQMINNLKESGEYKYSDMAVFYRTHAQSRAFEEAFRFADIQYNIVGGISFYERKEVKDILSYLTLLVNPYDDVSMRRIINTPVRGIGDTAVAGIFQIAKDKGKTFNQLIWDSPFEELLPSRVLSKIRGLVAMFDELRNIAATHNVAEVIRAVIEKVEYFDHLKKEEKVIAETRMENVQELVTAAEEFAANSEDASLSKFLEGISLLSRVDEWEDSSDRPTLMTIHCAKGLEFKLVIMVGMEDGLFPHSRSDSDDDQLEEERRLCYVGMTRAKERLIMCYTQQRMLYGRRTYCSPSQFLSEISDNFRTVNGKVDDDYDDNENVSEAIDRYI